MPPFSLCDSLNLFGFGFIVFAALLGFVGWMLLKQADEPALVREVIEELAELGSAERRLVYTAVFFGRPVPVREYRDESP